MSGISPSKDNNYLSTFPYTITNQQTLSPTGSIGIKSAIIIAISSTNFTTPQHTVNMSSQPELGRISLEDRDCLDGCAGTFQAAGHHQKSPHFLLHVDPFLAPSALEWIQASSHMEQGGGRKVAGSQLTGVQSAAD